ncbi:MAG: GDSL-type esterase/lipase family protein [Akkermansiaceae bacterium]|jgi:azurin/lysophospholipase L1-like esterase|tara:strand:- start:1717 stop:5655 length:3939 start_codon:yes stop_codon:yes gene_type:complete
MTIKSLLTTATLSFASFAFAASTLAAPLTYKAAKANAKGKHIVLIGNDHEYRSEETIPALARILSKHHGYDCTVLFGIEKDGTIGAGVNNMPGTEALKKADAMIISARFLDLPDDQMKHIDDYLNRGGPVLGMRTSTHAFKIDKNSKSSYKKHNFRYAGDDYKGGFGHQILGQSWVGHYGKNHTQSTRMDLIADKKSHPILRGVEKVWVQAGGYNAVPQKDWEILAMAQPLMSMKPDGKDDPKKPAMAGHWTRHYTAADGKKHRVVTSLYGASEDFLDEGYRRMIVNSVYWMMGAEKQIPAKSKVDFVGPYKPTTFNFAKHTKGVKPSDYADLNSQIPGKGKPQAAKPAAKKDKKKKRKKPAAPAAAAVKTVAVPADYKDPAFGLKKGDSIVIVGNGLADRMQHDGWLETLIQSELPNHQLTFRNMSLTGDQAASFPRSRGFIPQEQYLQLAKADVIFAFFGYNESFNGPDKASQYEKQLADLIKKYRSTQPNGKSFPRIVLFSPIAHENLNNPNLPNGNTNNARLAVYTKATEKAAKDNGVAFVNLYNPSLAIYGKSSNKLTINGIHLSTDGNRQIAEVIASALLNKNVKSSPSNEPLRQAVLEKNWHWHNRYRATDGNDVWGGRSSLSFTNGQTNRTVLMHELTMLDTMTANRDPLVWAKANGKNYKVNDSNVAKPIPVISNVGGGSKSSNAQKEGSIKYISGQEGVAKIKPSNGFEVNLYADEKRFPELVNPVQMQVDGKGRLWAAAWTTYPKWEPLKEMNDRILILPDDNNDGVADRCITFAKVHNPLGFEFWNGGVIVTSMPDILFLKDTDGDDIADVRVVLVQGIGSSDTHHSANNLIHGPDGAIYWQSGVFLANNMETPWGPSLRSGSSAMYRFDPRTYTITLHAGNSPNPHGISFDRWGYHYATDGTGGRAYQVVPKGNSFTMQKLLDKTVRPVPANEIISSTHFPDEMQGNFMICNSIGFLGLKNYKLDRNGETGKVWGKEVPDMLVSSDKNFRPTDAIFGEDGALYVADWSNVIIGHMQHNVRDPNRDHQHGRIYRITAKGRPLQKPVKIAGASIEQLLENLKHPTDGVRHRTRIELSAHSSQKVIEATQKWIKQFDANKKEDAHHLLEALWLHQQHNIRNQELLTVLLKSPELHARNAAKTVNHHWNVIDLTKSTKVAKGDNHAQPKIKSGVTSDTKALTEVRIGTLIEKIQYDIKEFTVKSGKKLKITFVNPDFMPHNIVFVKPGTADAVAADAAKLGADGFKKQFVPDNKNIIIASKLIDNKGQQILEFTAPSEPGNYPFVCTFPGHDKLMRGIMKVTK